MPKKKFLWMKVPTGIKPKGVFQENGENYKVVSTPVNNWAQVLKVGDEYEPTRSSKPKKVCECVSSAGVRKTLYPQRQKALKEARKRGWVSSAYRCPTAKGYHLTKS